MKFKAKLDDDESREFWESVRRGAREYDDYPDWKKGVLGGAERIGPEEAVDSEQGSEDRGAAPE